MTIKECYDLFNGDYSGVLSRLSEQSRVEKFAVRFLDTKDYEELTTSINSKIYGIGVNIYTNAGKIEVFNVIPATPADFAQIKQGDIIIAVDGKDTNGMNISEVAALVRGPENSVVELTLLRDNKKLTKKMVKDFMEKYY